MTDEAELFEYVRHERDALVRHVQDIDRRMAAAEARGYDKAVANLRDGQAFMAWLASGEPQKYYCTSARDAEMAAEFLEAQATKENDR